MLGYDHEEMAGMSVFDIDRTFTETHLATFLSAISEHRHIAFETIHTAKDGTEFSVEVRTASFESEGSVYVISTIKRLSPSA